MKKYALLKGFEGTDWKNMKLVTTGDLKSILSKFPGRDNNYILWWLIDIEKLPSNVNLVNIPSLFLKTFEKNKELTYKVNFIAGFHDDIAKNRSWGLLKKNIQSKKSKM